MDNHIPYRFIPIPTHLFLCLDNNCRSVLFALIQLSSFFADDKGWFFRTNADLEAETNLSKDVAKGALYALFLEGIIEVIPQEKGRGVKQESRKYKVNFDKFLEYEKISVDDCMKNLEYRIKTADYKHTTITFQRTSPPTSVQTSELTSLQSCNNIDSRENIENKETIYNNDNIIVKPNGNSIPDGDCSLSSSVEGSNVNPTDNTAIDGSCSFSDAIPTCSSEPDGNRTTSYTLPTCSLSSSNPVPSTTYSPKGESSNPDGLKQHSIPREKEISSQQPSDSNASEGTVSVSVPCQFEDGDSCAQTGIQDDEIRLIQALDVLYRYDKNHLRFDAVSKQARNDATMLAMKCNGWDFSTAKAWVQEQRKENLENRKKTPKQDDSNPSIPAPAPEDNEAHRQELIDSLYSKLEIVVDYDLNQTPEDGRDKDALNDAIHLLMSINDCGYDEARDDIQAYRKIERRKAEEARIDAEVAKAAAILNDDPEPKPDYGEYSKMFIDDDALMNDDFDHAW